MNSDYNLVRSKRKTVALYVLLDGSLLVRAPLRASKKLIDAFVLSKAEWIEKQRLKLSHQIASRKEKAINQSNTIYYLGKNYPLEIVEKLEKQLIFDGKRFYLAKNDSNPASNAIEAWFRRQARQILNERVLWFSRNHHFDPKKIRITSARTRWGSCSSRGTVSFSWRLIMAPIDVIDYVVVHELVHLNEKNHSRRFWEKVKNILPGYAQHVQWLKSNGHSLRLT